MVQRITRDALFKKIRYSMKSDEVLWDIMWGLDGLLRVSDVILEMQMLKCITLKTTKAQIKQKHLQEMCGTQLCKWVKEAQWLKKEG